MQMRNLILALIVAAALLALFFSMVLPKRADGGARPVISMVPDYPVPPVKKQEKKDEEVMPMRYTLKEILVLPSAFPVRSL